MFLDGVFKSRLNRVHERINIANWKELGFIVQLKCERIVAQRALLNLF